MLRRLFFAAASALLLARPGKGAEPAPASRMIFRIETSGRTTLWAEDRPVPNRDLLLFHRFPGGTLMSVRRSDVKRISQETWTAPPPAKETYDFVDIGVTGGGSRRDAAPVMAGVPGAAASRASRKEPPGPGARPDGTALFNPDRKYQPDIDAKQVPGATTGFPNSANDYREGRTLGYPAAPAVQSAPGEPPRMPPSSGEVPKGPQ